MPDLAPKGFLVPPTVFMAGMLLFASLAGLRHWRQRRVAAHVEEKQIQWHGEFMRALIGMVGQDTHPSRRIRTLRRAPGWTHGHTLLIFDYLRGRGFVKDTTWMATEDEPLKTIGILLGGSRVKLTEEGLDEV